MRITLKLIWSPNGTWGDREFDQAYGVYLAAEKWEFETTTRQVVYTPFPLGGDATIDTSIGEPPPEDISLDTAVEFYFYAEDATRYGYFHNGLGGFAVVPQTLTVTATAIGCDCYGTNAGLIDITASGIAPGQYTYLWNDGVTTADRGLLAAGTYTVTVRHESGAQLVKKVVVGQNPQLVVVISKLDDGLLVTATGGTPGYTFLWEDGTTNPRRTGLGAGSYSCEVRDSLGCGATVTSTIETFRFFFSHDPISLRLDAGDAYRQDPTTKPELSFVCEVYLEKDYLSDVWERVGQALEQPADRDGRTVFEVQELLEPYVSGHLPAPDQVHVERADPLFRRFYLRHQERTADGLSSAVTLDYNFVVHGGLSFEQAGVGTWFNGYQDELKPFFTWEPLQKKVLPTQPEYLYFMPNTFALTRFKCQMRVFRSSGESEVVTFHTQENVNRYELYCLPVGVTQRQLASDVVRYEIFVTDEDDVLQSERRTYLVDRRPALFPRYFLYQNSLGGLNTLCCKGRAEAQLATKTQSSEVPRVVGYDPLQGDVSIDRKTGVPTLKLYTGARSAEQLLADQDFLLSERVVLLEAGRYRSGMVKDRSVSFLDEDETRRVLQFDFELPRERHYSPYLRLPTLSTPLPPADV